MNELLYNYYIILLNVFKKIYGIIGIYSFSTYIFYSRWDYFSKFAYYITFDFFQSCNENKLILFCRNFL